MYSGHAPSRRFFDTMLLSFFAKKRAEVAPGVGKETDMFWIGPNLGSYTDVGTHVLAGMDSIYKTYQKGLAKCTKVAEDAMRRFSDELTRRVQDQASAATASQSSTPGDPGPVD